MRYYIIAGEASGDLHASELVRELKAIDADAVFRGWGGDKMAGCGVELVKHYRDLAFMGFLEVITNLKTILGNIRFCEEDILEYKPDLLILVDYPGFNLRIAKSLHKKGIRIHYYISPQLWAWHKSRVRTIRDNIDQMFVILPFEKDFYADNLYRVDYVGHPLLDIIGEDAIYPSREEFLAKNGLDDRPIISLLPGSRLQEIRVMLGTMVQVIPDFSGYQFVIAGAPSQGREVYAPIVAGKNGKILFGQTYDLLHHSHAALVTSGTATLETALMHVPQVVCYKGNPLSYMIARRIVNVKYISLVNLIAGKEVVKELIQGAFTVQNLSRELRKVTEDESIRESILKGYEMVEERLGGPGASARAAAMMVQYLRRY
jgi:lipid-A-disaccharide synthase